MFKNEIARGNNRGKKAIFKKQTCKGYIKIKPVLWQMLQNLFSCSITPGVIYTDVAISREDLLQQVAITAGTTLLNKM